MKNEMFSYLIKMQIGPHNRSMLVVNKKEVPMILLETMAKEKISKIINELYPKSKDYRLQTSEQFFSKMIKQSDFVIDDLNNIEVLNLDIKFEGETISNTVEEGKQTKIFQSKFNDEKESEKIEGGFSDFRLNDV